MICNKISLIILSMNKIILKQSEPARPGVACSDFGVFARHSLYSALDVAVDAINDGTPNKYIGNPGIINDLDQTPLVVVITHGRSEGKEKHIDMIRIALSNGADPNLPNVWRKDNTKIYPLERAFESGSIEIVELLLNYGAFFRTRDVDGFLESAIYPSMSLDMVKKAISLGARVNRKHIQKIAWRWRWEMTPEDEYNDTFVKIWKYLYTIEPKIADFIVDSQNWNAEHGMRFEDWMKQPRIMGFDEKESNLTLV